MNQRRHSQVPFSLTHRPGHDAPRRSKVEAHVFPVNGDDRPMQMISIAQRHHFR
jgi:hypothetical protein